MYKSLSRLVFSIILATILSSCLATKSYKKPDVNTQNLYPFEQLSMDSSSLAEMPWQQVFKDPQLQKLIQEALKNNFNLKQAIEQIRIAEANFYQGQMNMLPSLSLGSTVSHNEPSDNNNSLGTGTGNTVIPATEQYGISLSTSWELDVWGKLNSAKKARFATLLQSEATRRAIQTSLIANVANSYYRLIALDKQLAITRKTVKNRKEVTETIKNLKESSLVTGVSVQQSIASQYAAEITIPELKQQITEQEHALSILLGRSPGKIKRESLDKQHPIDSLAAGLPAELLRNRPDILAAEYKFRSAFELTNNARAYFYPSFTLTARGGYQSLTTEDLFKPGSIFYNLAAGLTQPLFNKGVNKARLKKSKAQQKQAKYNLRNTIIKASQEVSNALSQYKNADQKLAMRQQQLSALKKAVKYSNELLTYGDANYTEVLTAQQQLLSAQINNINDRLQKLTAGVNLYRALGGGWEMSETITNTDRNK
ncbi:efflux transporter outer membrane subunit [Fodinibius halophilus]|uniref:TolC family protein n=1 Tax=Fodinibius halophilus TaxID=1736908 RepID=A0A6M1STH0_9BACT|nr:TolC family protein [Fodinibius halophilus]NGP87228.1 TolC family protein [Fodinibius halophilus]